MQAGFWRLWAENIQIKSCYTTVNSSPAPRNLNGMEGSVAAGETTAHSPTAASKVPQVLLYKIT